MQKTSELIWQDKQHQRLFELIDDINTHKVDGGVFARLRDYAENHFLLEEEYMQRLDYPHIQEHIDAHNRFRDELTSMMENFHEYDESFRETLTIFLSEWLKKHIYGIDKDLEKFVLNSDHK